MKDTSFLHVCLPMLLLIELDLSTARSQSVMGGGHPTGFACAHSEGAK